MQRTKTEWLPCRTRILENSVEGVGSNTLKPLQFGLVFKAGSCKKLRSDTNIRRGPPWRCLCLRTFLPAIVLPCAISTGVYQRALIRNRPCSQFCAIRFEQFAHNLDRHSPRITRCHTCCSNHWFHMMSYWSSTLSCLNGSDILSCFRSSIGEWTGCWG